MPANGIYVIDVFSKAYSARLGSSTATSTKHTGSDRPITSSDPDNKKRGLKAANPPRNDLKQVKYTPSYSESITAEEKKDEVPRASERQHRQRTREPSEARSKKVKVTSKAEAKRELSGNRVKAKEIDVGKEVSEIRGRRLESLIRTGMTRDASEGKHTLPEMAKVRARADEGFQLLDKTKEDRDVREWTGEAVERKHGVQQLKVVKLIRNHNHSFIMARRHLLKNCSIMIA